MKNFFFLIFLGALIFSAFAAQTFAQRRDHLTEAEIELVRDAQEIDERMKIFVKAIDRRFLALNADPAQLKSAEKESESWGKAPTGTRLQLLNDIEKLLDEAISKIDDAAARDGKNELFPAGVHILAEGASKFLPLLKTQLDNSTDEKEKGSIIGSIDFCNQIIEASAKVPKLTPKEIKKIKSKQRDAQQN